MGHRKYIIDHYGNVALFSEVATHSHIATRLNGDIVGAGFFTMTSDGIHTYGESISLGVKCRGDEDAEAIRKFLFGE